MQRSFLFWNVLLIRTGPTADNQKFLWFVFCQKSNTVAGNKTTLWKVYACSKLLRLLSRHFKKHLKKKLGIFPKARRKKNLLEHISFHQKRATRTFQMNCVLHNWRVISCNTTRKFRQNWLCTLKYGLLFFRSFHDKNTYFNTYPAEMFSYHKRQNLISALNSSTALTFVHLNTIFKVDKS